MGRDVRRKAETGAGIPGNSREFPFPGIPRNASAGANALSRIENSPEHSSLVQMIAPRGNGSPRNPRLGFSNPGISNLIPTPPTQVHKIMDELDELQVLAIAEPSEAEATNQVPTYRRDQGKF